MKYGFSPYLVLYSNSHKFKSCELLLKVNAHMLYKRIIINSLTTHGIP